MVSLSPLLERRFPLTKEELEQLLGGEELMRTLDIKTLVLDIVKRMDESQILNIFWKELPHLSDAEIKDYFYMRRG